MQSGMLLKGSNVKLEDIEIGIIEGPGVRISGIIGAFQALETAGIYQRIKRLIPSSGAVIVAFMAALGISPKEMMTIVNDMAPNEILDPTYLSRIPGIGPPLSILIHGGINTNNALIRFAQKILESRKLNPNLTFKELEEWQNRPENAKNPNIKKITFAAVNNSTLPGVLLVFSGDRETQNVPVARAFAGALAYPTAFIHVDIFLKGKFIKCSDGGARDNYLFSLVPVEQWDKCVGLKLDMGEEIFDCHYKPPSMLDKFLTHILPDNDFISRQQHGKNSIQFFDGDISVLKPITLLDRYGLYVSGHMATHVAIQRAHTEESKSSDETKWTPTDARTVEYKAEFDKHSSRYILPTYLNLFSMYNKINDWNDELHGCCVHYNALLDQLLETQSIFPSLCDALSGQILPLIRLQLFELLRERGEKAAFLPEATPNLITDITLAFLHTEDYDKAYDFLVRLQKNSEAEPKLVQLNHKRILAMIGTSSDLTEEQHKLKNLVESFYEKLLVRHPGTYETYLIIKFGEYLAGDNYPEAHAMLDKIQTCATLAPYLEGFYDAAFKQFPSSTLEGGWLREMISDFQEKLTDEEPPRRNRCGM